MRVMFKTASKIVISMKSWCTKVRSFGIIVSERSAAASFCEFSSPTVPCIVFQSLESFRFFGQKQKSSRTDHVSRPRRTSKDYVRLFIMNPVIVISDVDHEVITKITKPLREVFVILITNRSPNTRLQLVTRDPDHDQNMI